MIAVDLIVLSRDASPLRPDVQRGIDLQTGLPVRVHRVFGTPRPDDPNRWETIARARNSARRLGSAPLVFFLDDDVVLGAGCIARLVEGLRRRPGFAAYAADCAGEMTKSLGGWDHPHHVGMASVLFRRERLAHVTFRWEGDKCECLCCCNDLRRAGFGIGYLPGAQAWHRPEKTARPENPAPVDRCSNSPGGSPPPILPGRILSAFDRRDFRKFRRQFVTSLRASGNPESLTAVAYGLHPSERDSLAASGVNVVAIPGNAVCPALRRLRDFQDVISSWPEDTPVAYWDAGDVVFQGRLEPLWDLVRAHPNELLVVRDTASYDDSPVIVPWSNTIRDPESRRRAFDLISSHVFLNSGFAAGTVRAMMGYLREGDRLLNSRELLGVGHWGDQMALNLYCHTRPDAWREIPASWNYCLACRRPEQFRVHPGGRIESLDGSPVHVVHGNAMTLGRIAIAYLS